MKSTLSHNFKFESWEFFQANGTIVPSSVTASSSDQWIRSVSQSHYGNSPWMGCQSMAHTHSHLGTFNVANVFGRWEETRETDGNPHRHGRNMENFTLRVTWAHYQVLITNTTMAKQKFQHLHLIYMKWMLELVRIPTNFGWNETGNQNWGFA